MAGGESGYDGLSVPGFRRTILWKGVDRDSAAFARMSDVFDYFSIRHQLGQEVLGLGRHHHRVDADMHPVVASTRYR